MFSGTALVNYLSTLQLSDDVLRSITDTVPGVEIMQLPVETTADIPDELWAQVDVLHTSTVLPDPVRAPRLRWIQLDTSGVDHVRHHPVWESAVPITTIGGVSPVPLAEYVLWAILGTAHRFDRLLDAQRGHDWPDPQERWATMLPASVRGATLGIVGYGRIGREIGRLAGAFGMTVLGLSRTGGRPAQAADYYGSSRDVDAGAQVERLAPDRLGELMQRSDYVVVVVPLTDASAKMIDAAALAQLRPGAVLINVARGGIVDEDALRHELRSGRIRAAVLDVFDAEPLPADDPWWEEPGVFVTPHVSGLAPDYAAGVLDIVCENLRRLLAGQQLINLVNRDHGY